MGQVHSQPWLRAKLCSRAAANNVLVMLFLLLRVDQLTTYKSLARTTCRFQGVGYKASVIGTRLSPAVAIACVTMAVVTLFF
jgi:hypothetical protein